LFVIVLVKYFFADKQFFLFEKNQTKGVEESFKKYCLMVGHRSNQIKYIGCLGIDDINIKIRHI
jgi:hypothetical protein